MNRTIARILTVMTLAFVCMTASAQSNPFDKYADTQDVTYVYISKAMLNLLGSKVPVNVNGINIKQLSGMLNSIQVITSATRKAKESLKDETLSIVKKGKYESLTQINENDTKVNIYHKESKDNSIIVMLTDGLGETVVVVFSGTFKTADIMKMAEKG